MSVVSASRDLKSLSKLELLELARNCDWVHTIPLSEDFTTPGMWGKGNPEIWRAFDQIDFRGKSVLDIGCWDGQWSFEAEARGASRVVATDLISQRDFSEQNTFCIAAAIRNSVAEYMPDLSVYDVHTLASKFDIVLYMGVYYHLKDPVSSITKLRNALNTGGKLLIEGAVLTEPGCHAKFFYKSQFCGDNSNWWVPTRDCLREWVECSFFDIQWEGEAWGHQDNQRHCIVAEAVNGKDDLYSRPPEELETFNV